MLLIRRFFNFRKPIVSRLDYIDIVIQDKMLLLLSWEFKQRYKLKISAPKKSYRYITGSVILKIPENTLRIQLTISSFWRKTRTTIQLKKLELDQPTSKWLIHQFNPMIMPLALLGEIDATNLDPVLTIPLPNSDINIPISKHPGQLKIANIPIIVHQEKMVYPN